MVGIVTRLNKVPMTTADRILEWAGDAGPAAAASLDAELRGFGLFQVPAYVVDGEVFYGRQHLPMIEWILNSRSGSAPI